VEKKGLCLNNLRKARPKLVCIGVETITEGMPEKLPTEVSLGKRGGSPIDHPEAYDEEPSQCELSQ
jgi:hypothetical protein